MRRRGVVLLIVLATVLVTTILAGVILRTISNQSRLTQHQVTRIKAYYVSKAMMNYTLEMLRLGTWAADPVGAGGANRYACHRACIDTGVAVFSPAYNIPTDTDIPYKVQVTIGPRNTALGNTATNIQIKTQFPSD